MALEDKIDTLITALGTHTAAITAAVAAGVQVPAAGTAAKAAGKTKPAAAAPAVAWADVAAKFDALKTAGHTPALKKIIADQGHATLKALEGDASKHESALAALTSFEEGLSAPAADEDDL